MLHEDENMPQIENDIESVKVNAIFPVASLIYINVSFQVMSLVTLLHSC